MHLTNCCLLTTSFSVSSYTHKKEYYKFPHQKTSQGPFVCKAMASSAGKLSYKKLKHEIWFDDEEIMIRRLRQSRVLRKVTIRKKVRVKIPRLTRFLKRAWMKVCKRLKESRSHFGDLFAGNYMFMQVTPTSLKYATSNITSNNYCKNFDKGSYGNVNGNNLGFCSSRLPNVAWFCNHTVFLSFMYLKICIPLKSVEWM